MSDGEIHPPAATPADPLPGRRPSSSKESPPGTSATPTNSVIDMTHILSIVKEQVATTISAAVAELMATSSPTVDPSTSPHLPKGKGKGPPHPPPASDLLGAMPPSASLASLPTTTVPAGISSLPTTLSFPLPSVPLLSSPIVPPTPPLLLSPSSSPIPAKLVTKVQSGAFVALKEFLGDNIALVQRLDEVQHPAHSSQWPARSSARMREISSPIQWARCLLTYAAVRCDDSEIRDILAYGRIILSLAQRHGGHGWLEYDRAFRQQAAADPTIKWNSLNPSLMVATVLSIPSSSPSMFCLTAKR